MKWRFPLPSAYIDGLRCFECEGIFREEPVKRVRIFSPTAAKQRGLTIRSSSDLEHHPELLLFEGHVDRGGKVYIADRRAPNTLVKVS